MSFDKAKRLLKPAEFKQVFDQRQSVHNAHFGLYFANNDLFQARLGLVVSKKVSKKAVVRNLIKRQVRESFRLQSQGFGNHDFVVVAKAPLANASNAELSKQLQNLWGKAINRTQKR